MEAVCYWRGINICKDILVWHYSDIVLKVLQEMRHGVEAGRKGVWLLVAFLLIYKFSPLKSCNAQCRAAVRLELTSDKNAAAEQWYYW